MRGEGSLDLRASITYLYNLKQVTMYYKLPIYRASVDMYEKLHL